MKLDATKIVLDHQGKPIKINDIDPETKQPTTFDITVRFAVNTCAAVPMEEDLRAGTQRFIKLGEILTIAGGKSDEMELSAEQISMLKERAAYAFRGNPPVVFAVLQALEGKFNGESAE